MRADIHDGQGAETLRSMGRIQMRETNYLQIVKSGLHRTAGPYRSANSCHRQNFVDQLGGASELVRVVERFSWAPLTTNGRRHSILRLACRTTFDHLSVSARMCAASSSGVLKVGSNPMVAIRSLMSGSAMIFTI